MPELNLGPFCLCWESLTNLCPQPREIPSSAASEGPDEASLLSRHPGTVGQYKVNPLESVSMVKGFKPSYICCVHVSPLQVTTSAQRRCPGRRHFPATRRSRARSTSSPCRWPAATPSATARGWCNDSRGCRPRWTVEPGASRQGRGAAGPLCTHHLP